MRLTAEPWPDPGRAVHRAQVSAGETHAPIFWHIVCLMGATVSASSNVFTEVRPPLQLSVVVTEPGDLSMVVTRLR